MGRFRMKPGKSLKFLFDGKDEREITINNLVVAGWTGRNVEAMEAHILELEELGIGTCPECNHSVTFTPTRKSNIYVCDQCDEKVYQYKNGKVHWYTLKEMPLMGVKPYNLSDK